MGPGIASLRSQYPPASRSNDNPWRDIALSLHGRLQFLGCIPVVPCSAHVPIRRSSLLTNPSCQSPSSSWGRASAEHWRDWLLPHHNSRSNSSSSCPSLKHCAAVPPVPRKCPGAILSPLINGDPWRVADVARPSEPSSTLEIALSLPLTSRPRSCFWTRLLGLRLPSS